MAAGSRPLRPTGPLYSDACPFPGKPNLPARVLDASLWEALGTVKAGRVGGAASFALGGVLGTAECQQDLILALIWLQDLLFHTCNVERRQKVNLRFGCLTAFCTSCKSYSNCKSPRREARSTAQTNATGAPGHFVGRTGKSPNSASLRVWRCQDQNTQKPVEKKLNYSRLKAVPADDSLKQLVHEEAGNDSILTSPSGQGQSSLPTEDTATSRDLAPTPQHGPVKPERSLESRNSHKVLAASIRSRTDRSKGKPPRIGSNRPSVFTFGITAALPFWASVSVPAHPPPENI